MTVLKDCNLSVLNHLHGDRASRYKHKDHFTPITVQLLHIDTIIAASLCWCQSAQKRESPEKEERVYETEELQPPEASLLIKPQFVNHFSQETLWDTHKQLLLPVRAFLIRHQRTQPLINATGATMTFTVRRFTNVHLTLFKILFHHQSKQQCPGILFVKTDSLW